MAAKTRPATALLVTSGPTSRTAYVNVEGAVVDNTSRTKRQPAELVQKAIMAGAVGAKKPKIADVRTALAAVLS